jgi:cytochrome c-type biogenesis protein CcmH/NrfG
MEPPYWYFPVRQSLGAVLLQAGRVDEAEAALAQSLTEVPNNGWAIYGLGEVAKARQDTAAQAEAEAKLDEVFTGDRSLLTLDRL